MENLLEIQYSLIRESREVVFKYLEDEVRSDILKPVPTFNDKHIAYMLVHVANTYIAWVNNFALGGNKAYYSEAVATISELRAIYRDIDTFMAAFCAEFASDIVRPVKGYKWPDKYIETNSYGIFTHVITHEFHHKGQSMTMSRLLGHAPPDTDVMRF